MHLHHRYAAAHLARHSVRGIESWNTGCLAFFGLFLILFGSIVFIVLLLNL